MRSKKMNKTKEKILSVTKELLKDKDYMSLTIQDIARAAELKHTVIYYYYKNKQAIGADIYNEYFTQLIERAKSLEINERTLIASIRTFLVFLHEELYNDLTFNHLFYGLIDYSSFDKAHLNRIVMMVRDTVSQIGNQAELKVSDDQIKMTVMIWEASMKHVLKSIHEETIEMSFKEAGDLLIENVLFNLNLI